MRIRKMPLVLALLVGMFLSQISSAQYASKMVLDDSPFTMEFDFLGNDRVTFPTSQDVRWTGFSLRIGATASTFGSVVDYGSFGLTHANWTTNIGGMYNVASQKTLQTNASNSAQLASTDRALGIVPSNSGFGTKGFAYTFEFVKSSSSNPLRFQFDAYVVRNNFSNSTTYQVRYGQGAISNAVNLGDSFSTGSSPGLLKSFDMTLSGLDSEGSNDLWFQIMAISDTNLGSFETDFFAIDNVKLSNAAPVPEIPYLIFFATIGLVGIRILTRK